MHCNRYQNNIEVEIKDEFTHVASDARLSVMVAVAHPEQALEPQQPSWGIAVGG